MILFVVEQLNDHASNHLCQSSSPHVRSVEAISGIINWTIQRAEALAHPLRFLHLQLEGSGTLIDLLQLCKMAVEDSDNLGELHQDVRSAMNYLEDKRRKTHRIVCFACLAESRRRIVDLFDHGGQILAHFIQSLGHFGGDLVASGCRQHTVFRIQGVLHTFSPSLDRALI